MNIKHHKHATDRERPQATLIQTRKKTSMIADYDTSFYRFSNSPSFAALYSQLHDGVYLPTAGRRKDNLYQDGQERAKLSTRGCDGKLWYTLQ